MAQPPELRVDTLRTPPQSVESEQSVIGGLLLAPEALGRVADLLSEADFYRRDHRLIYRGITELAEKGKPFDAVTLGEWFEAHQLAEQIGGTGYLIELASTTPSAANIRAYAEIVREKSVIRQLIEAGTQIVNDGFQPDGRDAADLLAGIQERFSALSRASLATHQFKAADLTTLMAGAPAPPRFVVTPYLPRGVVTLLGSHGGAGKTTLAEILAAHVACGKWWCNARVEAGRVVFFSLEDDAAKVAYKLSRIAEAYDLDADRVRANLRVFDWSQGDTALATEFSDQGVRRIQPTGLFARLRTASIGASLIVVDNTSDAFDGDETNRRQVGAFMRLFKGIAQENDCAVLLLAHIDKAAARFGAVGNSYSGSTAWHNAARSRLALADKNDVIELRQEKLNLGKPAEPVNLRWAEHGVLVPTTAGGDTNTNEGQDAVGLMAAIRAAAVAGQLISAGRLGPGNAHLLLSTFGALPNRLKGPKNREAFWEAMDGLIRIGKVATVQQYDRNRHLRTYLVEAGTSEQIFASPIPHTPYRGNPRTSERGSRRCGSSPVTCN